MSVAILGRLFLLVVLWAIAGQWPKGVETVKLTIDADMVQNIKSGNATANQFSSTDYVDLTCKVSFDRSRYSYAVGECISTTTISRLHCSIRNRLKQFPSLLGDK